MGRTSLSAVLGQTLESAGPVATEWVNSVVGGTPANGFTGWLGVQLHVGASPINMLYLSFYVVSGNSLTHAMNIIASDGVTILGSVTVNTSGATPGTFVRAALALTLAANDDYYIMSQVAAGGDLRLDSDATIGTTSVASTVAAVVSTNPGGINPSVGTLLKNYGPVSFEY